MSTNRIKTVTAMEILDSRGFPTVQTEVILENGIKAIASVPSGASTGKFEALELRDGDVTRYGGKGVLKAVENVNKTLARAVIGLDARDITKVDNTLLRADGTDDKSAMGANAILSLSLAAAKAGAIATNLPLYQFIGGPESSVLPVPMMNILNGGAHAGNNVDIQEFMIMPVGAKNFREGLRWCSEVYHTLQQVLKHDGLATAVGDEGGFAPDLADDEQAIQYILQAIEKAGYRPYEEFVLAIDAAASEWQIAGGGHAKVENAPNRYILPKSGIAYSAEQLIEHWKTIVKKYPVRSIEDGLGEEDWDGFKHLTDEIGSRVQVVGDDLFVTNTNRLQKGMNMGCGNSILVKLNQIGTLTETIKAVKLAQQQGYTAVISHRSGETEDSFIADLAVALNAGQIKTGAPCRSERIAKYNRLLYIENELKERASYSGKFNNQWFRDCY